MYCPDGKRPSISQKSIVRAIWPGSKDATQPWGSSLTARSSLHLFVEPLIQGREVLKGSAKGREVHESRRVSRLVPKPSGVAATATAQGNQNSKNAIRIKIQFSSLTKQTTRDGLRARPL